MKLKGKKALVIAAGQGIGRAIAEKALAQSMEHPSLTALSPVILARRSDCSRRWAFPPASLRRIFSWVCLLTFLSTRLSNDSCVLDSALFRVRHRG